MQRIPLAARYLSALPLLLHLGTAAAQDSGSGTLWVDYDRDGRLDLLVFGNGREDVLYRSTAEVGFLDVTLEAGLAKRSSSAAASADFDLDGRTDLVLIDALGSVELLRGDGTSFAGCDALSEPLAYCVWSGSIRTATVGAISGS